MKTLSVNEFEFLNMLLRVARASNYALGVNIWKFIERFDKQHKEIREKIEVFKKEQNKAIDALNAFDKPKKGENKNPLQIKAEQNIMDVNKRIQEYQDSEIEVEWNVDVDCGMIMEIMEECVLGKDLIQEGTGRIMYLSGIDFKILSRIIDKLA